MIRKTLLLTTALLVLATCAFAAGSKKKEEPAKWAEAYNQGVDQMKAGDFAANLAIAVLTRRRAGPVAVVFLERHEIGARQIPVLAKSVHGLDEGGFPGSCIGPGGFVGGWQHNARQQGGRAGPGRQFFF